VNLFWQDKRLLKLKLEEDGKGGFKELDENDLPDDLWRPCFDMLEKGPDIPQHELGNPEFDVNEGIQKKKKKEKLLLCVWYSQGILHIFVFRSLYFSSYLLHVLLKSYIYHHTTVEVFRPAQGILQLNIPISGTIHNPHNLKNFPFDEDIIEFTFVGDMLRDGRKADASDFRLIPIGEMPEPNHLGLTVPFLASYKDSVDSMPEFGIIGAVISASTKSKKQMKKKYSYVEFGVVIRRSFGYYFWKVVFMLWMVTALTFSIFGHDAVSCVSHLFFLVD